VVRLPLVVDDPATRHRVEDLFSAMWQVKRALQRDARDVVDAYWAGDVRRERDVKSWRAELGLSRTGLEQRAYTHLERSVWLADHVTKALVMHQADEVWNGVERHLFPDTSGRRAGRPRTGTWWEYTRIPGRARSHTTPNKWETFRLHGTLDGHLAAYHRPGPSGRAAVPAPDAALVAGSGVLAQPRHLKAPTKPAGRLPTGTVDKQGRPRTRAATWFDHTGPLTVVFNGGPASARGEFVLPVRLPQGAGRRPYLAHYLADPSRWHKIDLVRRRDAAAPGGWSYEAHLTVLAPGYTAPSTQARRTSAAALDRMGGVDGNVSNLAVVSLPTSGVPATGLAVSSKITLSPAEQDALTRERKKTRQRAKALDRSRRATNPLRYQPSPRQQRRDERRTAQNLPPKASSMPGGARVSDTAGRPKTAYRTDTLSKNYRTKRARQAMDAARQTEASHHRARRIAAEITAVHGARLTVEDCDIRTWFRLWGKACSATTPGRLITALDRECAAITGGRLLRASTFTTAWSQHCLCGRRVAKSLNQRTHYCDPGQGGCGLRADRDLTAAAWGCFTTLTDPDDPASARLDFQAACHTLHHFTPGLQEALTESTVTDSPPPPRGRSTTAAHRQVGHPVPHPRASARRNTGPRTVTTPDETRTAPMRPKAHTGTTRPRTGRPRITDTG